MDSLRHSCLTSKRFGSIATLIALLTWPYQGHAWSARKTVPAQHHATHGRTTAKHDEVDLAARVAGLLKAPHLDGRVALLTLKSCVLAREMALAVDIAQAIAVAPGMPASVIVDAASALAQGQDLPVQRQLWQKAWQMAGQNRVLGPQIAQGYADALAAAGQATEARAVVDQALKRTAQGQRRGLFERLVALARVQGDLQATVTLLQVWSDPDAFVLTSELQQELGQDSDALASLRQAWQRFPMHRGLQAAYSKLLVRQGEREELQQLIAQVVHRLPSDPLPWLAVIDADIEAKANEHARELSDELANRYPRHEALLEALIDREQRLGADPKRIQKLYTHLLTAAPKQMAYYEAWADWLISRGQVQPAEAVLMDMRHNSPDPFSTLQKIVQLWLNHGRYAQALHAVGEMQQARSKDLKTLRMLALVTAHVGKPADTEPLWLELTALADSPTQADRSRALEARQALVALYRKLGVSEAKLGALTQTILKNNENLGAFLLLLDLYADRDAPTPAQRVAWQSVAESAQKRFGKDSEVLQAIIHVYLQAGDRQAALPVIEQLAALDADSAEEPLTQWLEWSLARGQSQAANRAQGWLLHEATDGKPSAAVLVKLGDLRRRYGDVDGAAVLYRRAAGPGGRDVQAVARLAALFRAAGRAQDEQAALREIVARATQADDLEDACNRLLMLSVSAGHAADLVRWLDAVAPQHPRRDLLLRVRTSAYDAWLRAAPLETALGERQAAPAANAIGDAVQSGELAQQVRVLHQSAALHQPLPTASIRLLLTGNSAVLRRDMALVLGMQGDESSATLLVQQMLQSRDNDEDVIRAQMAALAVLPPVAGVTDVLHTLLQQPEPAAVAAVLLGKMGAGNCLKDLRELARSSRRDAGALGYMAVGLWLGHLHSPPAAESLEGTALADLLRAAEQALEPAAIGDLQRPAALLWSLAAADLPQARQRLQLAAIRSPSPTLQSLALRLLAHPAPKLEVPAVPLDAAEQLGEFRNRLVRFTLMPWVVADSTADALALQQQQDELASVLANIAVHEEEFVARWCARWRALLPPGPLHQRCLVQVTLSPLRVGAKHSASWTFGRGPGRTQE